MNIILFYSEKTQISLLIQHLKVQDVGHLVYTPKKNYLGLHIVVGQVKLKYKVQRVQRKDKMAKASTKLVRKVDSAFLWVRTTAELALGADQLLCAFSSTLNNGHWIPFLVQF